MKLQEYIDIILNDPTEIPFLKKVRDEWHRFHQGKPVDTKIVPIEIYASWKRCKEYELDPFEMKSYPVHESRKKELDQFNSLLNAYQHFFNCTLDLYKNEEFSFSIGTCTGIRRIISNKGLHFPSFVGECHEGTVGTTASTLAHRSNKPALLTYHYFYKQDYFQNVNSVAAPIHDENNNILGTIGISYYDLKQSPRAYWLVTFLAKTFNSLYLPVMYNYEKKIEQILNFMPEALAFVDEKNIVHHYNEKLLQLLKLSDEQDIQTKLGRHLPKLDELTCPEKVETEININENKLKVYVSPIKEGFLSQNYRLIQFHQNLHELLKPASDMFTFDSIIGKSTKITEAKTIAENVAKTDASVLIFGESGTGKELFAQAIHNASERRNGPFIAINCGALPAEIVESELFGYEEGSFTGALKGGKIGKLEAASGGTIFLDEIESMPIQDQIKLLRVLSTGRIQRIGSTEEIPINIRLISATKKDLLEEADKGQFRDDLYFRISTFTVELPPLRDREGDIALLAEEFISKYSLKYNKTQVQMCDEFLDILLNYHWRGNVRELENTIEHAIILLGNEKILTPKHLPPRLLEVDPVQDAQELVKNAISKLQDNENLLTLAENMVIEHVLKSVNGNITAAAKQLGISRRTIYNKMREHPHLQLVR